MEGMSEDIVIVGAGIAGLTTALGLHRQGIRSLVLESSSSLRSAGFAFTTWPNAWRALDAVGVGDSLRRHHRQLLGLRTFSTLSGLQTAERLFDAGTQDNEMRCVQRKNLLETLERELPSGTIRYSSKVVSIEESGHFKLLHLVDGSILRAKVLIGCDGVSSVVAKWLGFQKPAFAGRHAIRGSCYYSNGHGFEPMFLQFFGDGMRAGVIPYDKETLYWFMTWSASTRDKQIEKNPDQMKQFVLSKLGNVPDKVRAVFEDTKLDSLIMSPLKYRHPWELIWGNISKGTVCVTGDAFHPMTPDLGQGGCATLEDSIVLARCLGQALRNINSSTSLEEECKKIETGLKIYARERKWRAFELTTTAYVIGYIQQSTGKVLNFLRDKVLAYFLAGRLMKMASYDFGKL